MKRKIFVEDGKQRRNQIEHERKITPYQEEKSNCSCQRKGKERWDDIRKFFREELELA